MSKNDVIVQITAARSDTFAAVDGVSEELLCQPQTIGEWSVKDVLLHLSRWEAELVKLLFQAKQGADIDSPIFADDFLKYNDGWWAEGKDRPLEAVMADMAGVRQQLLRRLNEFSDAELDDAERFSWMKHQPLSELVIDLCVGHETHHNKELLIWRQTLS